MDWRANSSQIIGSSLESHSIFIYKKSFNTLRVAIWATLLVLLGGILFGCSNNNQQAAADSFSNRTKIPILHTQDVSSLISDSGITRYHLLTPDWYVYDKAQEPYWYFPKGVYVEKYDSLLKVEATIKADTAYFFERKKLWKLIGNVQIMNLQSEHFETPLLFWDQIQRKIYSDSFISIKQPERILFGYGFESDETMTNYTIHKTSGTFLVNDDE